MGSSATESLYSIGRLGAACHCCALAQPLHAARWPLGGVGNCISFRLIVSTFVGRERHKCAARSLVQLELDSFVRLSILPNSRVCVFVLRRIQRFLSLAWRSYLFEYVECSMDTWCRFYVIVIRFFLIMTYRHALSCAVLDMHAFDAFLQRTAI